MQGETRVEIENEEEARREKKRQSREKRERESQMDSAAKLIPPIFAPESSF